MNKVQTYFIGDVRLTSAPISEIIKERNTFLGDGVYYDADGTKYVVDSGVLGIAKSTIQVDEEQAYQNEYGVFIGKLVNLEKENVDLEYEDGLFIIGNVAIQTKTKNYVELLKTVFDKGE